MTMRGDTWRLSPTTTTTPTHTDTIIIVAQFERRWFQKHRSSTARFQLIHREGYTRVVLCYGGFSHCVSILLLILLCKLNNLSSYSSVCVCVCVCVWCVVSSL